MPLYENRSNAENYIKLDSDLLSLVKENSIETVDYAQSLEQIKPIAAKFSSKGSWLKNPLHN